MRNIEFSGYENVSRLQLVNFSPGYLGMLTDLRLNIRENQTMNLCLVRITDVGVSVSPPINFSNLSMEGNFIKGTYFDDHYQTDEGQKIPQTKTIRLDNPFGEVPIIPGWQASKLFIFGEGLDEYQSFIEEARNGLLTELGKPIQLTYKNDDGSFSVVGGLLNIVNRGNIDVQDYYEILVVENKTVSANSLDRRKNHRFISENGFLVMVGPAFAKPNSMDTGEVFGIEKFWNFKPHKG